MSDENFGLCMCVLFACVIIVGGVLLHSCNVSTQQTERYRACLAKHTAQECAAVLR